MGTCFVIQPFDKGPHDKRYKDVLVPAIKAADLDQYRVDEDPAVSIPIDSLADITTNNPNAIGNESLSIRDPVLLVETALKVWHL